MMSHCRNKKAVIISALVFLVLFLGMSVQAEAAWKKNSNGTYSYYNNGKLVKSKWIDKDYYVDSNGIRKTGWLYKNKKWYFFANSGKLLRSTWLKSGGKMYYAGKDGVIYTNGRRKIGDDYYAFSSRGVRLTGKRTYSGKTYFFATNTGRMLKKQWVLTNKKYYYYGADGVMVKNKWVGRYYVNGSGARVTSTWKGDKYLGADGKAVKGLQEIGSSYYYFDPDTYKKVVDITITVDGISYKFGSSGKGKIVNSKKAPATKVNVEKTYYKDVYVDDETLLAALIYCEAGNQSYTGQLAVGAVIVNRMNSSLFPNMLREVIYQKQQFAPARDGSLTKALKNPSLVNASCQKAAKEIMDKYETFQPSQKVYITISGKKTSFPYLFFMTQPAYKRLGLTTKYKKIGDHVFFTKWK